MDVGNHNHRLRHFRSPEVLYRQSRVPVSVQLIISVSFIEFRSVLYIKVKHTTGPRLTVRESVTSEALKWLQYPGSSTSSVVLGLYPDAMFQPLSHFASVISTSQSRELVFFSLSTGQRS
jgi:hypothetical protein